MADWDQSINQSIKTNLYSALRRRRIRGAWRVIMVSRCTAC